MNDPDFRRFFEMCTTLNNEQREVLRSVSCEPLLKVGSDFWLKLVFVKLQQRWIFQMHHRKGGHYVILQ